ncbi:MAG: SDR family NAD(P)-dependent oxidoreductase [Candidatus Scalindua sp.]|jgi:NAD dependent epimerase/dehydratase|nr:SDR family NAD(P)-dependent oxidoreductase [Candidatus Scalindua sp.]
MNICNKKVLVTGADGFIGSHLVEALLDEGCNVKAFTYYNSFNSWGWLDTFPSEKLKNIEVFTGDIRDPNGVRTAVKDIDIIFHLAALIAIPFSYHSPDSYIDTNVKGTLNVLQACRDYDIERVIVTSTSEVYGTAQYVPIDEKHPLQGQSPYSASKIGADKIAESFFRSFGMPVVTARPFNAYGPRQSARAVIPTIITQLLNGNKNILLGSINPTRDFNYVGDVCKGFIHLAKSDKAIGKEVNIGSGSEISIGSLAELLIELTGTEVVISSEDIRKRPDKSEVERLVCDNSLIKKITEWKPETTLREGLLNTIEWFNEKENLKRYKDDIYNI